MGLKYYPVLLAFLSSNPFRFRHNFVVLGLLLFLSSCAHVTEQPPPTLEGTYVGTATGGEPLNLQLHQDENRISGFGTIGSDNFTISGLGSWYAPAILMFETGRRTEGQLQLSPDGNRLDFALPGKTISAGKTADTAPVGGGGFSGSYASTGIVPVRLTVVQQDLMIAGSGFAEGKPIAVVGRQTEPATAKAAVLFNDESRASITITVTEDGNKLTIKGLGAPLVMRRQ